MKRRKRMFGGDSDEEAEKKSREEGFVELKPEVIEFESLHAREEELFFYDSLVYPWDKDKHYKMVYKMEKKFFPDQSLDKAFLEPGNEPPLPKKKEKKTDDDKGMVFFEEKSVEDEGVIEKKSVGDFFKGLKKEASDDVEPPYLLTRSSELPRSWDSPTGTVVLINKPKGLCVCT